MIDESLVEASIAAQGSIALLHDQIELLFRYAPDDVRRSVRMSMMKLTEARLWLGEATSR